MTLDDGFNLLATAPDGIKRLRELILSLAVQGKLVPQDPSDEPASELLKKIRAEKDRLIAEGKIKKDKPLPAIDDDEKPFALPAGWEWVRLPELAQFIDYRGKTPVKKESGIPLITAKNIRKGYISREPQEFISEGDYPKWMTRGFPKVGDILFTTEAPLGNVAVVNIEEPFALAQRVICFGLYHPATSLMLKSILLSQFFQSAIVEQASGVTAQGIKSSRLQLILIPLPPLAEQSRIVAKVEELMALCDALEARGQLEAEQHARLTATLFDALAASESAHQLQENWARLAASFDLVLDRPQAVDALEQTILQLAVRGLLVPQDPADEPASELLKQIRAEKDRLIAEGKIRKDKPLPAISDEEKPFDLPQGWEWVRLNQLLSKIGAGSTPLGGREVYVSEGVKFLRSQNVWNDGLRLADVAYIKPETHEKMRGTVVVADDLLFNITGASIGRCAAVPADFDEANVSQHVTIVRPVLRNLKVFLHLTLTSNLVQQAVMDVQVGVSREGLSISKLGLFLIPLPPLAEQSRIVARVEALRALCGQLRQRLVASRDMQGQLASALLAQG